MVKRPNLQVSILSALVLCCGASIGARAGDREAGKDATPLLECVQPDYAKWEQVREGMSEEKVKKLLGEPLHDTGIPEEFRNSPTYVKILTYGRIRFASPAMPGGFEFHLTIKQGKVCDKTDPFGAELSKDGKPTTPVQTVPKDRTYFDHYPRFVDLRWQPSSGAYPVSYVIEVEHGQHESRSDGTTAIAYKGTNRYRSDCPYQAISFVGMSPGRWRVMATNKKGESQWSEWRYFRFER